MGRPLRHHSANTTFFVTSRCLQAMFLLRPDPEVNAIIGCVVARATERYESDIDLHAFCAMSNHVHFLVSTRHSGRALSEFVGYIECNIAKLLNRHWGRSGKFWHRRFSAERVLDEIIVLGLGRSGHSIPIVVGGIRAGGESA